MAYEIPQQLEHKEKIIFGLTFTQLGWAMLFGLIALLLIINGHLYIGFVPVVCDYGEVGEVDGLVACKVSDTLDVVMPSYIDLSGVEDVVCSGCGQGDVRLIGRCASGIDAGAGAILSCIGLTQVIVTERAGDEERIGTYGCFARQRCRPALDATIAYLGRAAEDLARLVCAAVVGVVPENAIDEFRRTVVGVAYSTAIKGCGVCDDGAV